MKNVLKSIAISVCLFGLLFVSSPVAYGETIESYGTEYIAISNNRPGEKCVITALFEPTTVTLSNGQQFTLMRGERHTVTAAQWTIFGDARTRSLYIHADEPIRVEHTTSFGDNYVTTLLPSLSCESAIEQHYTFVQKTPKASLFLIAPAGEINDFLLDGKVLKGVNSYAVSGNDEWVYQVIDLGTRKAGSTLSIVGHTEHYYAAIVGFTYEYLNDCELEASVSIDTLRSTPRFNLHYDPMLAVSTEVQPQQNTGSLSAAEEDEEEDLDKELEEMLNTSHRAVLYLQGAYAAMPLKLSDYTTRMGLGYGAAAGVLYEFQKRTFLMQTGAGFYWLDRRVDILDQPAPGRYDRSIKGGVEIPLMFGQNFKPVYYLLGVKFGIDLLNKEKSVCKPVNETPLLVKPDITRETKLAVALDLDPRLSAEFGFNLGQERNSWVQSRLAVFADWGFYPMNLSRAYPTDSHPVSTSIGEPSGSKPVNPADYSAYELTHFYRLPQSAGAFIQHFQVGLKFTLVLGE